MKLIATRDTRVTQERGGKKDFQKGDLMEVDYMDSVAYYERRWFKRMITKDMDDKLSQESIKEEKQAVITAMKMAWNSKKKSK
jgi:hypothetical protein